MRIGAVCAAAVLAGACSGGKQAADGGSLDASAGSVTFHLVVPSTLSFCDEFTCATGLPQHLRISASGGQPLALQAGNCTTSCSSANVCMNQCPAVACVVSQGFAVTTADQPWDGRYQGPSACGASCLVPTYAPPGTYVAQFCATPGTLTMPDGGQPVCTATGAEVCGPMVPFTFPSSTPVELTLGAADAG
jgi:hypothetical protein